MTTCIEYGAPLALTPFPSTKVNFTSVSDTSIRSVCSRSMSDMRPAQLHQVEKSASIDCALRLFSSQQICMACALVIAWGNFGISERALCSTYRMKSFIIGSCWGNILYRSRAFAPSRFPIFVLVVDHRQCFFRCSARSIDTISDGDLC